MTTTIIQAVKIYIATYTELATGAPLWVNYLGASPTAYSIVPLAGSKVVEEYITGGTVNEFPFAFQSMESTADELERLESLGFYEAFAAWLKSQTLAGTLPTLNTGQTPEKIEALGWAYLYEQGESGTGVYQIQCKLTYEEQP
jgi:hypothetical protein